VETRKITFRLPDDLIREAESYAARHDTTVNAMVRDLLASAISRDDRARAAADRLLAMADRGPFSNVDPASIARDELHERP
jgi:predicted transcriptional regulator